MGRYGKVARFSLVGKLQCFCGNWIRWETYEEKLVGGKIMEGVKSGEKREIEKRVGKAGSGPTIYKM